MKQILCRVLVLLVVIAAILGLSSCNIFIEEQEAEYDLVVDYFERSVIYGSKLDISGLSIEVTTENNVELIPVTEDMIVSGTPGPAGEYELVIKYKDHLFSLTYEVFYKIDHIVDGLVYDTQLVTTRDEILYVKDPVKTGSIFIGWSVDIPEVLTGNIRREAEFIDQLTLPNLTATYGDTLADIELPEVTGGHWEWKDPLTTSVGNAGTNKFSLVYVFDDSTKNDLTFTVDVAVAKKKVVFTVEDEMFEYDGSLHTIKYELSEDIPVDDIMVFGDISGTNIGEYSYTLRIFNNDNYEGFYSGKFVIAKKGITITVLLKDQDGTYKDEVTIKYGDEFPEYKIVATDASGNEIDLGTNIEIIKPILLKAGEHSITTSFANDNYSISINPATLKVSHATLDPGDPVVLGINNITYGDKLSTVFFEDHQLGYWKWDLTNGDTVGEAGEHTFTAIFVPKDSSYNEVVREVIIQVNPKKVIFEVTSSVFKYDENTEHSLVYVIRDFTTGAIINEELRVLGNEKHKNAGTHTIELKLDENNYAATNGKFTLTILQKEITADFSFVIRTEWYPDITLSSISLPDGYTWDKPDTDFSGPQLDGYEADVTYTPSDTNYAPVSGKVIVILDKATATLTSNENMYNSWVYNGEDHALSELITIESNSSNSRAVKYYLSGTNEEITTLNNAGTYNIDIVIPENEHYTEARISVVVIVKKATPMVERPVIDNWVYGSEANTPTSGTNVDGIEVAGFNYYRLDCGIYYQLDGVPTQAGEYYVTAYTLATDNYAATESEYKSFVIEKKAVAAPAISNFVYNGALQIPTISDANLDVLYTVVENLGGTDVGTYSIILALKDSSNYKWADDTTASAETVTIVYNITSAEINLGPINGNDTFTYLDDIIFTSDKEYVTGNETEFGEVVYLYASNTAGQKVFTTDVPTEVGSYVVKAVIYAPDNNNWLAAESEEFAFVITKKAISAPTLNQTSDVFNGNVFKPTVEHVDDIYTVVYESENSINTGRYKVTLEIINNNYKWDEGDSSFVSETVSELYYTITAATPEIYDITSSGWTYGSTAPTHSASAKIGDYLIENAVTVSYYMYSADRDKYEPIVAPTEAGTYYVKFKIDADIINGNWIATESEYIEFVIEQKSIDIPVLSDAGVYTYTGSDIAPALTETESHKPYYSVYGSTALANINAGTYTVEFKLKDSNYKWIDGSTENKTVTYTIAQAATSVSDIEISGWIYNESANEPVFVAKTTTDYIIPSSNIIISYRRAGSDEWTEDVPQYAGTYYVKVSVVENSNWAASESSECMFVISKADYDMSDVKWNYSGAFTYNGSAQKVELVGTLPTGVTVEYYGDYVATNAGNYTANAKFSYDTDNYNEPTIADCEWTINKLGIAKPTENTNAFVYNTNAHTYIPVGFDADTMTITGNVQTLANESGYAVTVTITDTNNYTWTDGSQDVLNFTFVIERMTVTAEPTVVGTYTYTGVEQPVNLGVLPSYITIVSGNTGTDVGGYEVVLDLDDNYKWSEDLDGKVQWSIGKAKASIDVDQTDIVKTFGDVWTLPEATSNFGEVTIDKVIGDLINAGSYTVTYTVAGTDNYDGDTKTVKVTINKKLVTEPSVNGTYVYSPNTTHTVDLGTIPSYMTIVSGNTGMLAGGYEVVITLDSNHDWDKSIQGNDGKVQWNITKAQLARPSADTTVFTYTGNAHTYVPEGFDADTMSISGNVYTSANEKGYTVTVTIKNTDNYEWVDGGNNAITFTFVINKAKVAEPTLTDAQKLHVYTGSLIVSGYEANADDLFTSADYGINNVIELGKVYLTLKDQANYKWDENSDGILEYSIVKATAVITNLSITGWVYGKSANAPTATTNFGNIVYEYKLLTDGDDKYTTVVPQSAGTYVVRATVAGTNNWYEAEAVTKTFEISKATPSVEGDTNAIVKVYGDELNLPVIKINGSVIDPVITYKAFDGADYESVEAITNAGYYKLVYVLLESANYVEKTVVIDVTINKVENVDVLENRTATYGDKLTSLTLLAGWSWKNADENTTVGNAGTNKFVAVYTPTDPINYASREVEVTITVAKRGVQKPTVDPQKWTGEVITSGLENNSIYTVVDAGSTEVGIHEATLTLCNTNNYYWIGSPDSASIVVEYRIANQINNWTTVPSIPSYWTYGETPDIVIGTPAHGTVTVKYAVEGTTEYSDDCPTDAGKYVAVFTAKEDNYDDLVVEVHFEIKKATVELPTFKANTFTYTGSTIVPEVNETDSDKYTYENIGNKNVGTYTVTFTLKDEYTANYQWINGSEKTVTLSYYINKADAKITNLTITNWTYGESASVPNADNNFGTIVYEYKLQGAADSTYTTTVPHLAGDYVVRASIAGTDNWNATAVTKEFSIEKANASISISTEGKDYLVKNEDGTYTLTKTYTGSAFNLVDLIGAVKTAGENDLSYSKSAVTTVADSGIITISIAGSDNYNATSITVNVVIEKADIEVNIDTFTATFGDALSDLTLPISTLGTWTWADGEEASVGAAGTNTFVAIFTATNPNYNNASVEVIVNVAAKSIVGAEVTLKNTLTYNGTEQDQEVASVSLAGFAGITYDVSGDVKVINAVDENGNVIIYSITVTGTGNYEGSVTITYTVARKAITADDVTLTNTALVYTGGDLGQYANVSIAGIEGNITFDVTGDTTVVNAGTNYSITVTGTGNFVGEVTKTFAVDQRDISGATVTPSNSLVYSGANVTLTQNVSSITVDGYTFTEGYRVVNNTAANAGTYKLKVEATSNNLTGYVEYEFTVAKADVSYTVDASLERVYGASGWNYVPVVAILGVDGEVLDTIEISESITGAGSYEFSYVYTDNTNNYNNKTVDLTVDVSSAPAPAGTITATGWQNSVYNAVVLPTINVTVGATEIEIPATGYTIWYAKQVATLSAELEWTTEVPTNVGTYYVKVVVDENKNYESFEVIFEETFTISVKEIAAPSFEAGAQLSFTFGDIFEQPTLVDSIDSAYYTISTLADNRNAGKYTYVVTLNSEHGNNIAWADGTTEAKEFSYVINRKAITNNCITHTYDGLSYTGSILDGTVTVVVNGTTLVLGEDYKLDLREVRDAGDYTITVTGIGNYTGEATASFNVAKFVQDTSGLITNFEATYGDNASSIVNLPANVTGGAWKLYESDKATVARTVGNATYSGKYNVFYARFESNSENYASTDFIEITIKVNKAAPTISVPTIDGSDFNFIYTFDNTDHLSAIKQAITYTSGLTASWSGATEIKSVGEYTLTITLEETANYEEATADIKIKVNAADLTNITLGADLTYNGAEQTQTAQVYGVNNSLLVLGTDYTLTGIKATAVGEYTVIATGIGNYEDSEISAKFKVLVKAVAAPYFREGTQLSFTFGTNFTQPTLTNSTDSAYYTISALADNKNAGTYTYVVTLKSEHGSNISWADGTTAAKEFSYVITKADLIVPEVGNSIYNGLAYVPTIDLPGFVTVTNAGGTNVGEYTVTLALSDADYANYNWQNDRANATVSEDGKTVTITYSITALSINADSITRNHAYNNLTYRNASFGNDVIIKLANTQLVKGVDYTVSIVEDGVAVTEVKNAGKYVLTITGIGNYKDEYTVEFTVSKASASVTGLAAQYNGVYLDGTELKYIGKEIDLSNIVNLSGIIVTINGTKVSDPSFEITYNHSYTINGTRSECDKILNAGYYDLTVSLVDDNYAGSISALVIVKKATAIDILNDRLDTSITYYENQIPGIVNDEALQWNITTSFAVGAGKSSVTLSVTITDNNPNYIAGSYKDIVVSGLTFYTVAKVGDYASGTPYGSIEKALADTVNATSATTIWVMDISQVGDVDNPITIRSNATVGSKVTLILPYNSTGGRNENGTADASNNGAPHALAMPDTYRKTLVVIDKNVTLTVNGSLEISGVLSCGASGADYSSHTGKEYAELQLRDNATLECNGVVKVSGVITDASHGETSRVIVNDGGTIWQPFILRDFGGGSFMTALKGQMDESGSYMTPFLEYQFENVQATFIIYSGGTMNIWGNLTASDQAYNSPGTFISNNSEGFLELLPGAYLKAKYNPLTEVVRVDIYGGAVTHALKLSITNVEVSTAQAFFPLNWAFDVHLHNGNYDASETRMKIVFGGKLTIHNDATLTVKEMNVYENYQGYLNELNSYSLGSRESRTLAYARKKCQVDSNGKVVDFANNQFVQDGKVIVNGTLIAGKLGGRIYSEAAGGKVVVNNSTECQSKESAVFSLLSVFSSVTKSITMKYTAQLYNAEGTSSVTPAVGKAMLYDGSKWVYGVRVEFDVNAGDAEISDDLTVVETGKDATTVTAPTNLPVPTRDHYIFDGWYMDAACTNRFDSETIPSSLVLKVYAKWTPIEYTIKYEDVYDDKFTWSDGDKLSAVPSEDGKFTIETVGDLPAVSSGEVAKFKGWYYLNENGEQVFIGNIVGDTLINYLDGDNTVTLYAYWTQEKIYTVKFENNKTAGNTVSISPESGNWDEINASTGLLPDLSSYNDDRTFRYYGAEYWFGGEKITTWDEIIAKLDEGVTEYTVTIKWSNKTKITISGDNGLSNNKLSLNYDSGWIIINNSTEFVNNFSSYVTSANPSAYNYNTSVEKYFTGLAYNGTIYSAYADMYSSDVYEYNITGNWVDKAKVEVSFSGAANQVVITDTNNSSNTATITSSGATKFAYFAEGCVVSVSVSGGSKSNSVSSFTNTTTSGSNYIINGSGTLSVTGENNSGGCVTGDTLITLADGTQKRVDQLTGEELLLVWNLETGRYEAANIVFIDSDPEMVYEIIHLYFSDGSEVKVISEHGFFDLDLAKYVYIDADNYSEYIGHRFVTQGDINSDSWNEVTLTNVVIEYKVEKAWSPVTFKQLCYYTNGVLSMPGGIEGLFNIFEVDTETMTYDAEKMQADIEMYGLFTLEDFGGMIPEIAFEAFNGAWLKVAIGKGMLTWEDIAYLAERYVPLV